MASPEDMVHQKTKQKRLGPPPGTSDLEAQAFEQGFKSGETEGRRVVKTMVLTFLQKEYMAPTVERGKPYGKEILTLTSKLSKLLK